MKIWQKLFIFLVIIILVSGSLYFSLSSDKPIVKVAPVSPQPLVTEPLFIPQTQSPVTPLPQPIPVVKLKPEELAEKAQVCAKQLKEAKLGTKKLAAKLKTMTLKGDEVDVSALLALSEERFEEAAILEALGQVRKEDARPQIAAHLRRKIAEGNVAVMGVAFKSYGQLMGDASVGELQNNIKIHWGRPDGCGEQICAAAVEALGSVNTSNAQAALIAELERVNKPDWLPDYGSIVVATLKKRKTPEAAAALKKYAEGLARKMPPENNPPGRKYIEEKIAEAKEGL